MPRAKAEQLAIDGGPRAVDAFEGKGEPKIGVREFMELADLWGFSPERTRQLRDALDGADAEIGGGPFLNRYYNPRPSKVDALEDTLAKLLGAKYLYAVSSGTAALHCAYVAAGIGPGDEVLVPGYTFMATASAVVQAGAIPVFCEIDESMTIDPADVERKITQRTKAVAPVHMAGAVCNMKEVMRIARKRKLAVIEDCAQAFGTTFKGKRVGTFGDLGCFSISSYKYTGGGECGLVVARTKKLWQRAMQMAECGGLWRPVRFALERWPGEFFCGGNYRLCELVGAVNLIQVQKADGLLERWRRNKRRVLSKLKAYEGITPQVVHDYDGESGRAIGFFPPTPAEGIKLAGALRAEGIGAATHAGKTGPDWHIYFDMEPILGMAKPEAAKRRPDMWPYQGPGRSLPAYSPDMCPRTNDLYARMVSINVDPSWTARDSTKAARAVNKVLGAFYATDTTGKGWLD